MYLVHSASSPGAAFSIKTLEETFAGKAILCLAASTLVALSAHLTVPLPFTPVPLTLSNFAVLLVGLALAPATAFSALLLYLVEGAIGLPVFTPGGASGAMHLLGPTGGFLIAYPFAAALTSFINRVFAKKSFAGLASLAACTLATLLILVTGAVWLSLFLHLTPAQTLRLGVLPFLPGEAIKIVVACGIVASMKRIHRERLISKDVPSSSL